MLTIERKNFFGNTLKTFLDLRINSNYAKIQEFSSVLVFPDDTASLAFPVYEIKNRKRKTTERMPFLGFSKTSI